MWNGKIPFDSHGLRHYGKEMVDNFIFTDELRFDHFVRGRSSAYAIFIDSKGRTYPMFLTYLSELLLSEGIKNGLTGNRSWTFYKRGQNFSYL